MYSIGTIHPDVIAAHKLAPSKWIWVAEHPSMTDTQ